MTDSVSSRDPPDLKMSMREKIKITFFVWFLFIVFKAVIFRFILE